MPIARPSRPSWHPRNTLADFKDRLKGSKLPEQAQAAELKHREDLEQETQKALAANEMLAESGGWRDFVFLVGGWLNGVRRSLVTPIFASQVI